jgi:small-conductance mechanosensitive channel
MAIYAVDQYMDKISESARLVFGYSFQVGKIELNVAGLLAALLTLLVVWSLSRLMQKAFTRYAMRRQEALRPAIYTVSRLAKYILVVTGVLIAAGLMGIPLTQFAVLAGAIGVGLGFGLQAIFSNFISGLILLFDRSLKVGDFVELESGVRGEVTDIGIRATRIMTNDNIDVLVPNSEFVTGRVVNWTLGDNLIRMHVPFGVDYGVDKDLVKMAALEAAAEVPFTLTGQDRRKPQVWLVEFAESSLNFELVVWLTAQATKRPGAVKAAYTWALDNALRRHGIGIPFPTTDLNIRSLFGLQGRDALRAMRGQIPQAEVDVDMPVPAAAPSRARNDALEEVESQIADSRSRRVSRTVEKSI